MTTLILRAADTNEKFGVVVVTNNQKGFIKDFRISADELQLIYKSKNSFPTCVTQEEWESGNAVLYGHHLSVGDTEFKLRKGDKEPIYKIKVGERIDIFSGKFTEDFLIIPAADTTGKFPFISVTPQNINLKLLPGITALTITDGVVTII